MVLVHSCSHICRYRSMYDGAYNNLVRHRIRNNGFCRIFADSIQVPASAFYRDISSTVCFSQENFCAMVLKEKGKNKC